jgi:hypothetical protein
MSKISKRRSSRAPLSQMEEDLMDNFSSLLFLSEQQIYRYHFMVSPVNPRFPATINSTKNIIKWVFLKGPDISQIFSWDIMDSGVDFTGYDVSF